MLSHITSICLCWLQELDLTIRLPACQKSTVFLRYIRFGRSCAFVLLSSDDPLFFWWYPYLDDESDSILSMLTQSLIPFMHNWLWCLVSQLCLHAWGEHLLTSISEQSWSCPLGMLYGHRPRERTFHPYLVLHHMMITTNTMTSICPSHLDRWPRRARIPSDRQSCTRVIRHRL